MVAASGCSLVIGCCRPRHLLPLSAARLAPGAAACILPPQPNRPPCLACCAAGRYSRYRQVVGSGRFKHVYKGFDERQGIDVAWSKIEANSNGLSHEQMKNIVDEISYGLGLDHPHVIKVCWRAACCSHCACCWYSRG